MKEYRVKWCQCPHVHHSTQVLYVKAATADDAKVLARDHIERKLGIEWLSIFDATEAKPMPAGEVIGAKGQ
jgi:hypothetical protein